MDDCWALPRCLLRLTSLRELAVCQNSELIADIGDGQLPLAVEDSLPFLSKGVAQLCHFTSLLLHVSEHLLFATLPPTCAPACRCFGALAGLASMTTRGSCQAA